jgi:hypothetical protein
MRCTPQRAATSRSRVAYVRHRRWGSRPRNSSSPARGSGGCQSQNARARQFSRGPASRCLEPSVGASQSGWPRSTACRQPQAGPARQPSCGLRAAGRAHGQPPGVGLGRRPVARGATGWARAVGGKGRLIFLYSAGSCQSPPIPAAPSPPPAQTSVRRQPSGLAQCQTVGRRSPPACAPCRLPGHWLG